MKRPILLQKLIIMLTRLVFQTTPITEKKKIIKYHAKATKFARVQNEDDNNRTMPEGFFDDAQEAREKMPTIETTPREEPMESNNVTDIKEPERINKRLQNQRKDGPKVKGIGVASQLPAGFYDDKTKDANIRGVETPADKEKR